ncbi:conserved hypothetical protein [Bradyrhizobium sp. STM 3843]|uniref:DUF2336 domain-containing protein n=1 Tax=Bradyrhizobium sp. STM 3843 TaxID=551947 RepID=UPI00024071EB|nr:DUF2336 domain-containing protein [Bradyrhizobium sp. STM 3843]CCE06723.1 conserved hypothetical protein [Bradyrhizobium sp. STM 3843]
MNQRHPALQPAKQPAGETRTVSELSTEILRKTTALLLSGPRPHATEQLDLYDQIFARLMPQVAVEALAELSAALGTIERAPYATARLLASHADVRVAAPMLAKAAVLSDRDLADFIKTSSQPQLVAVASRKAIGEPLTELLIARGYPAVRMALVQNLTARFSEDGYRSLFKAAERDEDLAEKLGQRADLPAKLSRAFVAAASDVARARFIKAAPPATKATLQATPTRAANAAIRATWDYTQIKGEIAVLNRTGKLGDAAVNRFAATNDYPAVIAALALLSDVSIETIECLMDDDRIGDLLIACKASRLSWATTSMILRGRPGCARISNEDFEESHKRFDKLVLSEAQLKVRGLKPT